MLLGAKKQGEDCGETMPPEVERVLWPQIVAEAYAREFQECATKGRRLKVWWSSRRPSGAAAPGVPGVVVRCGRGQRGAALGASCRITWARTGTRPSRTTWLV